MMKLLITFGLFAVLNSVVAGRCQKNRICPIPYTPKMQKEILAYHNNARSKANPTAADMQKMYWDNTMARIALMHSKKCKFQHSSGAERRFGGYRNVGQNLFASSGRPNATTPASAWYSEVRFFHYGKQAMRSVGHYTQMMQGKAARIGCGAAYCPHRRMKYIVTCNYLKGQYDYSKPYMLGKPCAACPNNCKQNMCDCNGKVCLPGKKINLNTCKC